MARLRYPPPTPEPDQEPRAITYKDIERGGGAGCDKGSQFWGDHWEPVWKLWQAAPWEKEPEQSTPCVLCKSNVPVGEIFEHVEENHPISRVRCPLCDTFLYPCELREHFFKAHSMTIRGVILSNNEKPKGLASNPEKERQLTETILCRRGDGSYTAWTPFQEAWKLYSWPKIRLLRWRFECPVCRKLILPSNLYRHMFTNHATVKGVECYLCGKRMLGGMLDYHFEVEHDEKVVTGK